jgi:glycosyltransferase involved in cell wall biosynthesis
MNNKKSDKSIPDISIIVPAYQAQKFIYDNLIELCQILKKLNKSFEVICVVDGATDTTSIEAKKAAITLSQIKIFEYIKNRGKGYAVRYGMNKCQGNIIGFVDAGRDISYKDVMEFFKIMKNENSDIVVGSKRHSRSVVNYTKFRKLFSLGYQFYVKNLFGLSVRDTQVGMKIFKKELINKILPLMRVDGFAFDIEMLAVSQKLLNAKITEAPIHVNLEESNSTIKIKGGFLKNSLKVFSDTLGIYYRLNISGYYKKGILAK